MIHLARNKEITKLFYDITRICKYFSSCYIFDEKLYIFSYPDIFSKATPRKFWTALLHIWHKKLSHKGLEKQVFLSFYILWQSITPLVFSTASSFIKLEKIWFLSLIWKMNEHRIFLDFTNVAKGGELSLSVIDDKCVIHIWTWT